jgi:hypothetical protein
VLHRLFDSVDCRLPILDLLDPFNSVILSMSCGYVTATNLGYFVSFEFWEYVWGILLAQVELHLASSEGRKKQ